MTKQEFLVLIDKYLAGNASAEEADLLSRYYNSFQENKDWNENELGEKHSTRDNIFNHIQDAIRANSRRNKSKVFTLRRIAVAASVIALVLLGMSLWFNRHKQDGIARTEIKKNGYRNDVPPGGDKAILTLADGSTITLDDAKNGTLAQQGATKVIKLSGKLSYNQTDAGDKAVVYNTISTPRGGQYQIELADGSQVWLNAASSLRFPTAFTGNERTIEITGEAYFEVAKDISKPFIVKVEGASVQVLGTHFNVMAYKDEGTLKTTLLEGSVRFVSGNNASLLKPGQQSQLTNEGKISVTNGVDVDEVVAWKNGLFHFANADIATVMRQLSRWYDVDVVYQTGDFNDQFIMEMPRSSRLSEVLKVLELTSNVRFYIQGKKIVVMK